MTQDSLLAILGMALVTYLTRVIGPFLVPLVRGNQRLEGCLAKLPGSILVVLRPPRTAADVTCSGCWLLDGCWVLDPSFFSPLVFLPQGSEE
ncbi:MAG: AzlD family protein [Desulfovibrionales bacterium]